MKLIAHGILMIVGAVLPQQMAATIGNTNTQVALIDIRGQDTQPDQTLTTTIQDPNHPGEPWTVTTYKRKDESFEAFVRRHKDMVEAVRKALA